MMPTLEILVERDIWKARAEKAEKLLSDEVTARQEIVRLAKATVTEMTSAHLAEMEKAEAHAVMVPPVLPSCPKCGELPEYQARGFRWMVGRQVQHECPEDAGAPQIIFNVAEWCRRVRDVALGEWADRLAADSVAAGEAETGWDEVKGRIHPRCYGEEGGE